MVSALSFEAGSLVLGNEVCIVLTTSNRLQETALVCWYRKVGKHKVDYQRTANLAYIHCTGLN